MNKKKDKPEVRQVTAKSTAHPVAAPVRITLSADDFDPVARSLSQPWQPNAALRRALAAAARVKRASS